MEGKQKRLSVGREEEDNILVNGIDARPCKVVVNDGGNRRTGLKARHNLGLEERGKNDEQVERETGEENVHSVLLDTDPTAESLLHDRVRLKVLSTKYQRGCKQWCNGPGQV